MKNYDAAKRKRSKDTATKRTQVKYDEAIEKIKMNKTWIKWTDKTWRNIELLKQRI